MKSNISTMGKTCNLSNQSLSPTSSSVNKNRDCATCKAVLNTDNEREAINPAANDTSYGSVQATNLPVQTAVYRVRWYILLVLCGGIITQSVIWGTWGPITDSAKFVYGWDTTYIFILTNCGNAGGLVPLLFIAYIVQRKGLRISLLIATACLTLGSGLRVVTMKTPLASILNAIGQFLGGVAGCIFTSVPSQASEAWFPLNERTTATTIAVISNAIGGVTVFLLGPNIVSQPGSSSTPGNVTNSSTTSFMTDLNSDEHERIKEEIWIFLMIIFGMSAVLFISTLIYYPSKPKYPPSVSAAEVRLNFKQGLFQLIKQPEMWKVTLACIVPYAVYGSWLTLCYITFKPVGVSQIEAGWFGFSACLGGSIGGIIFGRIADSFFQQRMKRFLLSLFVASVLMLVWIVTMISELIPPSAVMIGIAVTFLGIFVFSIYALSYEVACETGYPIHEGVIGTLLTLVLNVGSVLFLLVQLIPNIGTAWMTWTLLGSFVVGLILFATLRETFKRYEIDISHDRLTEIEQ